MGVYKLGVKTLLQGQQMELNNKPGQVKVTKERRAPATWQVSGYPGCRVSYVEPASRQTQVSVGRGLYVTTGKTVPRQEWEPCGVFPG